MRWEDSNMIIKSDVDRNVITSSSMVIQSTLLSDANEITAGKVRFSEETLEDLIEEITRKWYVKPTFEYKCNNCGGTIEMDVDQHIFRCPYCGSVYAIGTRQVNG